MKMVCILYHLSVLLLLILMMHCMLMRLFYLFFEAGLVRVAHTSEKSQ